MRQFFLTLGLVVGLAGGAIGQTMDGSLVGDESFYGAALSQQSTQTEFGDASSGDPAITQTGGSEINQVFGVVDGGRLHLLVTGNLEANFNKFEVFIDSVAGGVNTLDGDNLPAGVDGFCCGLNDPNDTITDGALQRMDGFTFDSGFDADYYLTFSNGTENVNARDEGGGAVDPDEAKQSFWAVNAHYAELGAGASGVGQALGYQTAPRGLPQVLRNPHDVDGDGDVDAADYAQIRDGADPNGDGTSDGTDLSNWASNYATPAGLDGPEFLPSVDFNSSAQLGSAAATLPGLSQGELIDRDYALGAGGCADDDGDGCVAEELEFALDVASDETDNGSNHRKFENTVDLMLGFDNSNEGGVVGGTEDADPEAVAATTTGIEFSIPLSAIGDPTGDIDVTIFINGTGHDFFSNQFSGAGNLGNEDFGLSRGNLGTAFFSDGPDPPLFTLDDLPGDQFVTISQSVAAAVPEPTAAVLIAVAAGVAVAARRR